MWLFSGIGLTAFLMAVSLTDERPKSMEQRVWQAQRVKDMGATDEQVRQVQNDTTPARGMAFGFSLIGLVPIGVGLAYLIFYQLEGKHMAALVQRE